MDLAELTRDLEALRDESLAAAAASPDVPTLEALELDVLGKKGRLTSVLRGIGALPPDDRPRVGAIANAVRTAIEAALAERGTVLRGSALADRLVAEATDVTTPGPADPPRDAPPDQHDDRGDRGGLRPVRVRRLRGARDRGRRPQLPDAEHPARPPGPGPVGHALRGRRGPAPADPHLAGPDPRHARERAADPGAAARAACYRYEAIDASHASEFFQVEGLMVDEGTTMADLQGPPRPVREGHVRRGQADPLPPRLLPVHRAVASRSTWSAWSAAGRAARPARGAAG